jgi:GT2 family glycosyltransferase
MATPPLVSICLPHWQVRELVTLCLRSIRKYTHDLPYEVIVVDNGSRDESLDYLRSLPWIRLIERGSETPSSALLAHATALDIGLREARGAFFLSMHIDVIVKCEGWLRRLLRAIESDARCAAAGTGKLETPFGLYAWWKQTMDTKKVKLWLRRTLLRDAGAARPSRPVCPRDFCALYRLDVLRKHGLSFVPARFSPGEFMYLNLVERGYTAAMIPVPEMRRFLDHVVHGTAGLRPTERRLRHSLEQRRTERRLRHLLAQPHVQALAADASLDA